jgi:uncharacterized protein with PhoU and TrkA domain
MGNVKEILEELKNLSELMLDLGYSSVFFESKDIANEVCLLFESFEAHEERLYYHLFSASKGRNISSLISVMTLVESAKDVARSAMNMSKIVLDDVELHPVVKKALQESDESITRATIMPKSELHNKTIDEISMKTNTGIIVLAIRREKKWLFVPEKDTKLLENDILIATGSKAACAKLNELSGDPENS